jgi:MFS family permease
VSSFFATIGSAFAPLRLPNFRLYMSAQLISLIGVQLQATAQAWVVWELTRSEAALGIVTMLTALPMLLLSPWAGIWADRLDRRKLLLVTQSSALGLALTLALLVQTGTVQIWHVYGLAVLLGIITTLDFPTHQAFLGDLGGMAHLRKAVNLNAMAIQSSRTLGPALAGFLLARVGTAPAFWINGLSFLAVIAALWVIRAQQKRTTDAHEPPMRQLREALRFIRTHPRVQDMYLFSAVLTLLSLSVIINLLPSIADRVLGGDEQTLGLLGAASGIGAMIALLLVAPFTQTQQRRGWVMVAGMTWAGFWIIVLGSSTWLPLSMLAIGAATMGGPLIFPMSLSSTQLMAPPEMRGRLLSLFTMVSFGVQPFSAIIVGNVAERLGTPTAIIINGTLLIVFALTMLLLRGGLRRWVVATPPPEAVQVAVAGSAAD